MGPASYLALALLGGWASARGILHRSPAEFAVYDASQVADQTTQCPFNISISTTHPDQRYGVQHEGGISLDSVFPDTLYLTNTGGFVTTDGRGCIVQDAPDFQLRCLAGQTPSTELTIDAADTILFRGSPAFFLCARQVSAGRDPVTYLSPVPGPDGKCVTITLQASGCGKLVEPSHLSTKRADQGKVLTDKDFIEIHKKLDREVMTKAVETLFLEGDESRSIGPSHYYGCTIVIAVSFDTILVAHLAQQSPEAGNFAVSCTPMTNSDEMKNVIKKNLQKEMELMLDEDARGCEEVFVVILGNVPPATTGVVALKDWLKGNRHVPPKNIKYFQYNAGGQESNDNSVKGRAIAIWDHTTSTIGVYAEGGTPKLWVKWQNGKLVETPHGWEVEQ